ncbi:MAG: STAS/SEC14 domain-containing protein [Myxococcales bacterium]
MERGRVVLSTVALTQVDDLLILFQGGTDIPESEITAWMDRIAKFDYDYLLISIHGSGGMNSKQRARIGEFWKQSGREHPRTAVLTESAVQRHIATAMTWILGKPIKVLAPDQLEEALKYLGTRANMAEVSRTVRAVHTALEEKSRLKTG